MKKLIDKVNAMIKAIDQSYAAAESVAAGVNIPVNMMGNTHELYLCSMAKMQFLASEHLDLPLPDYGTHWLWLSIYENTDICVGVDESADSVLKAVSYIGFLAAGMDKPVVTEPTPVHIDKPVQNGLKLLKPEIKQFDMKGYIATKKDMDAVMVALTDICKSHVDGVARIDSHTLGKPLGFGASKTLMVAKCLHNIGKIQIYGYTGRIGGARGGYRYKIMDRGVMI